MIGSVSFAGERGLNGGDICEDHFKIVRDDIQAWILSGGSAGLILPAGIPIQQYNSKMLAAIGGAQVSCTDKPVTVHGVEKTCENFTDKSGSSKIICNSELFMQTTDSDRYVLVHHEYAGLAGFEENDGASSQYSISNQITGFARDQLVKKLAIDSILNETCTGGFFSQDSASVATQSDGTLMVSGATSSGAKFGPYPATTTAQGDSIVYSFNDADGLKGSVTLTFSFLLGRPGFMASANYGAWKSGKLFCN
jgi:hypothetical protein